MLLANVVLAASFQLSEVPGCPSYTQNVYDPRFMPGQEWGYRERDGDTGATLTVVKVDFVPGTGFVVFTRVDVGRLPQGEPNPEGFYAFPRSSLDASVTQMRGIVTHPYFRSAYEAWQRKCHAPIHASTVADTLTARQCEMSAGMPARRRQPRFAAGGELCKRFAGLFETPPKEANDAAADHGRRRR